MNQLHLKITTKKEKKWCMAKDICKVKKINDKLGEISASYNPKS